jgi:hypothetical protein
MPGLGVKAPAPRLPVNGYAAEIAISALDGLERNLIVNFGGREFEREGYFHLFAAA